MDSQGPIAVTQKKEKLSATQIAQKVMTSGIS